jgi:cytochrome c-type biogenesis protein CcmE
MSQARRQRLIWVGVSLLFLAAAASLVIAAFRENLVFFYTPSQVVAGQVPQGQAFRVGGLVEQGSLQRVATHPVRVNFRVSDTQKNLLVDYQGVLPDLFREGKGVVVQGRLDEAGVLHASEVLAKHDENYMPPEAQHALDQAQTVERLSKSLKP